LPENLIAIDDSCEDHNGRYEDEEEKENFDSSFYDRAAAYTGQESQQHKDKSQEGNHD